MFKHFNVNHQCISWYATYLFCIFELKIYKVKIVVQRMKQS